MLNYVYRDYNYVVKKRNKSVGQKKGLEDKRINS